MVNWCENGESSKFEVRKEGLHYDDLVKCIFFLDFKLWRLASFLQVDIGKSYVSQNKVLKMANEISYEIERCFLWKAPHEL